MSSDPKAAGTNHLPDRTIDFGQQILRLHRMAEEYRTLADGASSDAARRSYMGMATDYDDLAKVAEETLASASASDPASRAS